MKKIVDGMEQAYCDKRYGGYESGQNSMRAALLWLADNVSDEMVRAAWEREFGRGGFDGDIWRKTIKSAISAAIRAAAGGGE